MKRKRNGRWTGTDNNDLPPIIYIFSLLSICQDDRLKINVWLFESNIFGDYLWFIDNLV